MFFDPVEGLDRQALEELQPIRLRDAVRLAARSPFYSRVFRENSLDPDSLRGLEDLARIPLTGKEHLRETYPDGMLCLPISEMVRLHASSGTTGTATVIFHTAKDLRTWADLVARCFFMVGVRSEDVFQNMSGYGLFTGGLGIHSGAERLGCLTIPAGAGNSKRQIKLLQDFKVTVIHIIPSYALHLAAVFEGLGIDPRSLNLRITLVGAEPHTEETRRRIEDIYGLKAFNSSGLSEMNGPGVAFECPEQNGMHLWEDAFLAEIAVAIDPVTLKPVPEGQTGELVMTTLTREDMPILRYRTRDLTASCPVPARAAGRTGASTGSWAAVVGAIAGGIFGAAFFFGLGAVPGSLAGAFAASLLVEKAQARSFAEARQAAWGAMWSKVLGTVAKIGLGVFMLKLGAGPVWPG